MKQIHCNFNKKKEERERRRERERESVRGDERPRRGKNIQSSA